jgi:hypothetical protein
MIQDEASGTSDDLLNNPDECCETDTGEFQFGRNKATQAQEDNA